MKKLSFLSFPSVLILQLMSNQARQLTRICTHTNTRDTYPLKKATNLAFVTNRDKTREPLEFQLLVVI
jgi:hypothetical protein